MQKKQLNDEEVFVASADPKQACCYIINKNGSQYVTKDLESFKNHHGYAGLKVKEVFENGDD